MNYQNKLYQLGKEALTQAHSPYSKVKIGSAVLWSDQQITTGCNIENASYGGTVCGERVAICKGISENNQRKISEIIVLSEAENPWPPCGLCRQVMSEFATENTIVHIANTQGKIRSLKFTEIFPEAFTPNHLK